MIIIKVIIHLWWTLSLDKMVIMPIIVTVMIFYDQEFIIKNGFIKLYFIILRENEYYNKLAIM